MKINLIGMTSLICAIVLLLVLLFVPLQYVFHDNVTFSPTELNSQIGEIFYDDNSETYTIVGYSNESGFLTYGPYVELPKGRYIVSFLLKVNNESSSDVVANIDVFDGEKLLNTSEIRLDDFDYLGKYQPFMQSFSSNGGNSFEFRIFKYAGVNLEVSSIEIKPTTEYLIYKQFIKTITNLFLFVLGGLLFIAIITKISITKKILNQIYSKPFYLFLFVFIFYLVVLSGAFGQIHVPTGDEPHYLITTHSIVYDRDIYVENNYVNEDYSRFYHPNSTIAPHVALNVKGNKVPFHGIGLPILLSPFYFFLGLNGVRIFLAVIASLLVLNIYFFIEYLIGNKQNALITSLIIASTSPLLFYSHTIYPETLSALILVYTTRILYKKYNHENIPKFKYILCGVLIAFLPWLGIKYISIMFPLIILWAMYSYKKSDILHVISPILASLIIYASFMLYMFNSLSPINVYSGVGGASKYTYAYLFPFQGIFSRIAGLFFDQRIGLIFYAPIFILCIIGFVIVASRVNYKNNIGFYSILFLPSIFYFAMYIFSRATGGMCPPSRQLVAIIPPISYLLSCGLVYFSEKKMLTTLNVLYVMSVGIALKLLQNQNLLFNHGSKISRLLVDVSNSVFVDLSIIFPSFYYKYSNNASNWLNLLYWTIVFLIIMFVEYLYRKKIAI